MNAADGSQHNLMAINADDNTDVLRGLASPVRVRILLKDGE